MIKKTQWTSWLLGFLFLSSSVPSSAYMQDPPPHLFAIVTADEVDVHAEPSGEAPVVGRVWQGVRMTVYELKSGWLRVELSQNKTGWIQSNMVETVAAEKAVSVRPEPSAPPPEPPQAPANIYRIKPGDVIEVKSFKAPELDEKIMVRPDGYISLILLDDVYVSGLSPAQLDLHLTRLYEKHLLEPELTVILNEIREVTESRVFVGGKVGAPGEIPMQVPITVLQAVISAGGFLDSAKMKNVILIRKGERNEPLIYSLNLSEIAKGDGSAIQDNIYLQPYDIVYVPNTTVGNAGKFVDQYLNKIVPSFFSLGFSWFHGLTAN
jgi:protein involved in polysaccharide export with SLBB domain